MHTKIVAKYCRARLILFNASPGHAENVGAIILHCLQLSMPWPNVHRQTQQQEHPSCPRRQLFLALSREGYIRPKNQKLNTSLSHSLHTAGVSWHNAQLNYPERLLAWFHSLVDAGQLFLPSDWNFGLHLYFIHCFQHLLHCCCPC